MAVPELAHEYHALFYGNLCYFSYSFHRDLVPPAACTSTTILAPPKTQPPGRKRISLVLAFVSTPLLLVFFLARVAKAYHGVTGKRHLAINLLALNITTLAAFSLKKEYRAGRIAAINLLM